MQQQQVLDNLAMFVCDYNAMPHFSYANQSGAQVTDQANANASLGWGRVNMFGSYGQRSPIFRFHFCSARSASPAAASGRSRKRSPSRRSTIRASSN